MSSGVAAFNAQLPSRQAVRQVCSGAFHAPLRAKVYPWLPTSVALALCPKPEVVPETGRVVLWRSFTPVELNNIIEEKPSFFGLPESNEHETRVDFSTVCRHFSSSGYTDNSQRALTSFSVAKQVALSFSTTHHNYMFAGRYEMPLSDFRRWCIPGQTWLREILMPTQFLAPSGYTSLMAYERPVSTEDSTQFEAGCDHPLMGGMAVFLAIEQILQKKPTYVAHRYNGRFQAPDLEIFREIVGGK